MAENNGGQVADPCNKYLDCSLQSLSIEDLLRALFVKDVATGKCFYLNTVATIGNCDDMEQAIKCGTNESWEELLRKSIVLDDCGRPALAIFTYSEI